MFVDLFTEKQLDDENDLILDTLREFGIDGLRLDELCQKTELPDYRAHEILCELSDKSLVRFAHGIWSLTRKGFA